MFVPGAGLILARREWLGLAVALLFVLSAQAMVVTTLIAPEEVDGWFRALFLVGTVVVWGGSQWLLYRRLRKNFGVGVARELGVLCDEARAAEADGRLEEAHDLLRAAISINDEHEVIALQWAELLTKMDRGKDADRAWRRVRYLSYGSKGLDRGQDTA